MFRQLREQKEERESVKANDKSSQDSASYESSEDEGGKIISQSRDPNQPRVRLFPIEAPLFVLDTTATEDSADEASENADDVDQKEMSILAKKQDRRDRHLAITRANNRVKNKVFGAPIRLFLSNLSLDYKTKQVKR
jgi:hypothetical protein